MRADPVVVLVGWFAPGPIQAVPGSHGRDLEMPKAAEGVRTARSDAAADATCNNVITFRAAAVVTVP